MLCSLSHFEEWSVSNFTRSDFVFRCSCRSWICLFSRRGCSSGTGNYIFFSLRVTNYGSRISDRGLRITVHGLMSTDYELHYALDTFLSSGEHNAFR